MTAIAKDEDGNTRRLPSGLVTFVFTDIEASTRLYKALGEETAVCVFDLHNELLRAAWSTHSGYEVHTEGDSFFVVFEDPNDAVAACIDVQQRLAAAEWPPGGEVRVRIGIHCGLAAPRHDDYMALAVHQAARVMAAANGNQILITDTVARRLHHVVDRSIVSTGAFGLRDFDEPPVLHRIEMLGLDSSDQPPRATPANHHNLVPPLTSFIGRSADLIAVNGLLQRGVAVTLLGLGGVGKTRLATEVGLEVAPAWTDGVWMVELAEVVDPDLIAEEVAVAIGVDKTGADNRWNDVLEFIADRHMVLILDNLEHVIADCARLVPDLLRSCPNIAVLTTSREPLNCQGEAVYRVQPLELSFETDDPLSLPSVELFIDRARAVSADFDWTPLALADVLEICRHLDGLPLAIEIAAAQIGVLQLPEIRQGLSNRFRLLRSRDRALPARQRTMEGLLGWSYQLLDETEQLAFRRLAIFAGSFSIDSAEATLAGEGIHEDDVAELIWTLVDKSLIAADLSDSATRYRLLESVQHYALRLLIDNGDPVRAATALAHWLLEKIAPWKVNDRRWLGDAAIELPNIRSVVELISATSPELAQQLMCSVGRYHDSTQSYQAGIEILSWGVAALPDETPSRVALLSILADLMLRMGDTDNAQALLNEATAIEKQVGPPSWNDTAVARAMGEIATRAGDFDGAANIAEEALARGLSEMGAARMWNLLGIVRLSTGDQAGGLDAFQNELVSYSALDHAAYIGSAHGNIAEAAWRMGDLRASAHHQDECLRAALALGQQVLVAYSLIMASRLAGAQDQWRDAVQLQSCAEAMLVNAGHRLYEDDHDALEAALRQAQNHIDRAAIADATTRGRALTALEASALASRIFEQILDMTVVRENTVLQETTATQPAE